MHLQYPLRLRLHLILPPTICIIQANTPVQLLPTKVKTAAAVVAVAVVAPMAVIACPIKALPESLRLASSLCCASEEWRSDWALQHINF